MQRVASIGLTTLIVSFHIVSTNREIAWVLTGAMK